MIGDDQFLGIVKDGQFVVMSPEPAAGGPVRLTTIGMQVSVPPETSEVDLSQCEGQAIMVSGHDGGGWIYSAQVIDKAGPILTAVVRQVFGQACEER